MQACPLHNPIAVGYPELTISPVKAVARRLGEDISVSILDTLFRRKAPARDDFAKLIMNRLAQAGAENSTYDSKDFTLTIGGRNIAIFLGNAYEIYCKAGKRQREAILFHFCSAWKGSAKISDDFSSVRSSLMPLIRDASYFSLAELSIRVRKLDTSKMVYPTKPLTGSLIVGLAYDTEHSIHQVSRESFERWGATFEEALEEARNNLRKKTNSNGMVEEIPGLFRSRWADSYDAARMLLTDLINRLPVSGEPVAFIPNRDQLWVGGNRDIRTIKALLKVGEEAHFVPYSISPDLFVLNDRTWKVYVPEDANVLASFQELRRHRRAVDYEQQKDVLETIYKATGTDVFVASHSVFERQDGSRYSACIWSKGVDALLPEAEVVILLVDKDKKDHVVLPWEAVLSELGGLMEEQPDMLPKRYRVRSFPNEGQIARLRTADGPGL
jgi:uncharacterized protein YtpQ (UPF0354 family)